MVQFRKEQITLFRAYWSSILYTGSANSISTSIAAATLNAASVTATNVGNTDNTNPIRGIITSTPYNLVMLRNADTGNSIIDGNDRVIFGRITFSGGNYIISYLALNNNGVNGIAGTEVPTTLPANVDIEMLFPEVMNIDEVPVEASLIPLNDGPFGGNGTGGSGLPSGDNELVQVLYWDAPTSSWLVSESLPSDYYYYEYHLGHTEDGRTAQWVRVNDVGLVTDIDEGTVSAFPSTGSDRVFVSDGITEGGTWVGNASETLNAFGVWNNGQFQPLGGPPEGLIGFRDGYPTAYGGPSNGYWIWNQGFVTSISPSANSIMTTNSSGVPDALSGVANTAVVWNHLGQLANFSGPNNSFLGLDSSGVLGFRTIDCCPPDGDDTYVQVLYWDVPTSSWLVSESLPSDYYYYEYHLGHTEDGRAARWVRANDESIITPPTLSTDTHNYSPTDWVEATIVRLSSSDVYTITGFDSLNGAASRKTIVNVGNYDIVLDHDSSSSDLANRIITASGSSVSLLPNYSFDLFYDSVSARWRF